ncbi:hypothetical protein SESBI_01983 [Sesbania bispinosa]|nr:hypothetical protein SESBI_01983 [Sesbania bispinosa]
MVKKKMDPSLGRGGFLQPSPLFNSPSIPLTNPKPFSLELLEERGREMGPMR